MVETGSKQSQFELLQFEGKTHNVDIEQLAVARLTTLSQMQEFFDEFVDSLNQSDDPRIRERFKDRAKQRLLQATEDRPYGVFLRWSTFLNPRPVALGSEISPVQPARQPRQGRTLT